MVESSEPDPTLEAVYADIRIAIAESDADIKMAIASADRVLKSMRNRSCNEINVAIAARDAEINEAISERDKKISEILTLIANQIADFSGKTTRMTANGQAPTHHPTTQSAFKSTRSFQHNALPHVRLSAEMRRRVDNMIQETNLAFVTFKNASADCDYDLIHDKGKDIRSRCKTVIAAATTFDTITKTYLSAIASSDAPYKYCQELQDAREQIQERIHDKAEVMRHAVARLRMLKDQRLSEWATYYFSTLCDRICIGVDPFRS